MDKNEEIDLEDGEVTVNSDQCNNFAVIKNLTDEEESSIICQVSHKEDNILISESVSLTESDERINSHLKDNDNVEGIIRTCDNEYNEEEWKEQPNPEFVFVDNENKLHVK
ncbi:hypothetical protein FQA39_LY05026 [Lamprigera yunnana]|nr:hypothetical protein FQA39_LY05026 [Lamprigera yunnana]